MKEKIIVGITGASGAIYGFYLLKKLKELDIETHLIVSKSASITLNSEIGLRIRDISILADYTYQCNDIGARISSGSFKTLGMIIAPCSIKTMSEISTGITGNLISRAADVVLKERRNLVLMVRETPLHYGHIKNMLNITKMGGVIFPPVPAFYNNPNSIDDLVNHSIGRVLDLFGLESNNFQRWEGIN